MGFNIAAAVTYLAKNKAHGPTNHCARYVRLALAAGGINTSGAPVAAKDYGPFLKSNGFNTIEFDQDDDSHKGHKGDIVVIQPYKGGSPYGHIAMSDGDTWISDFSQTDMWGGPGYRSARPSYQLYRYRNSP